MSEIITQPTEKRAEFLEISSELEKIYQEAACGGDTAPPAPEDQVDLHYVCLVKHLDGFVYELDGDAYGPVNTKINLGLDQDIWQEPVRARIRSWMSEESNLNFSLMALVSKAEKWN